MIHQTQIASGKARTGSGSKMAAIASALVLAMLGVATLSPQTASSITPMLRRQLSLEENYGVKRPEGMQMVSFVESSTSSTTFVQLRHLNFCMILFA